MRSLLQAGRGPGFDSLDGCCLGGSLLGMPSMCKDICQELIGSGQFNTEQGGAHEKKSVW